MKILAIEFENPGGTAGDFAPLLEDEARQVWELYQVGVIREIYFRQEKDEAVLVLECPDMTKAEETLAGWLRSHPEVKIVARDRSMEYARGISEGAPQATQVADRWHLLVNLREALQRLLDRIRPELNALASTFSSVKEEEIPILRRHSRSHQAENACLARQRQRQMLHANIHRLRNKGLPIRTIARQLSTESHHDLQIPGDAGISSADCS